MSAPRRRVFKSPIAPTTHLVFDLETVTDPLLKDQEHDRAGKSRFPPPPAHRVVCAGHAVLEDYRVVHWGVLDGGETADERDVLRRFVRAVEDLDPCLVSMNGKSFDAPVVAGRCFAHGVPFPWYYRVSGARGPRYRYDDKKHLDLMEFLADYGFRTKAGLHVWSRLMGFPGKDDVSGTDVALLWTSGQRAAIADYCMCDVFRTTAALLRTQLVRGELALSAYRDAGIALLEWAETDVRTAGLAFAVDRAAFLLDPSLEERQAAE